ncbi:hypothetical protein NFI96_011987, partial [Prochilodus magdalenae]
RSIKRRMVRMQSATPVLGLLALLCCSSIGSVRGGRIVVMPVDGSHWLSMKILVEELSRKGHEMVVLVPEANQHIRDGSYTTRTFKVPYSQADLDANFDKFKEGTLKAPQLSNIFENLGLLLTFTELQVRGCEGLLYDEPLMKSLQEQGFDLLLTDPFLPCGPIIADALSIPAVYFLRGMPCGLDLAAAQCPSPPSYIPRMFTGNTDVMDFPQRVKNMLMSGFETVLCRYIYASFDDLASRYLKKDTTYKQLLGHGAIWLMRHDFTFEYPRPQMPNMVTIGGINCARQKPLTACFQKGLIKRRTVGMQSVPPVLGLLALLCCSSIGSVQGGRIVVVPVDGSHWLSMKILVEELSQKGHEMVVLVPEASHHVRNGSYTTLTFKVPYTQADLEATINGIKEGAMKGPQHANIFQNIEALLNLTEMQVKGCEGLLYDEPLMKSLQEQGFDLLLTDPFLPCGPIIADALSIPAVYFLRGMPCGLDLAAAQCPSPPSYVPRFFTGNTDVMNFPQRVKNMLMSGFEMVLCKYIYASFDELASRYLEKDTTYKQLLGNGAIWLMRSDFTFEYPRPIMPDMVTIGGINCARKMPLPSGFQTRFIERRMLRMQSVPLVLGLLALICCSSIGSVRGGRIVVVPVDGSHWLSLKILVEELSRKGHEMVVLVPDVSQHIRNGSYTTRTFKVPYTQADLEATINEFKEGAMEGPQHANILENFKRLRGFKELQVRGCERLLYDQPLMKSLQEQGFDLLLTDPFLPCGPIIADAFSIPVVFFLRGMPCGLDLAAAQCPSPPSYIPRFFTGNTDVMNFPQRIKNMLMSGFEMVLCKYIYASFDELASRYLEKDTTYKQLLGNGAIWLMRFDFTFEYPRPIMPNMVTIGGINCAKKKPLPSGFQKRSMKRRMVRMQSVLPVLGLLALLCCFSIGSVRGGKMVVMPVDGSHWLSMKILVEELSRKGHEMVVLVPEASQHIRNGSYTTRTFKVPYTQADLEARIEEFKEGALKGPMLSNIIENTERFRDFIKTQLKGCEDLLYNKPLMKSLQEQGFDLLLTDPFLPCGAIIANTLSIPAVYFLRGMPCGLDLAAAQCPSPPSYIPRMLTGNTDVMDFPQRVKNMLMIGFETVLCRYIYSSFDELASRYLETDTTYKQLLGRGAIWLMRHDFTFEYPTPLMPNIVTIGGINCAKKKPLPAELEEFVNGSGEHGFVVFTLGSMVSELPEVKAKEFFDAFRQIPQRVLWRYTGVVPKDAPENVKLMKWLPQNDLLAHPKAKAFITHGGTHGLYEGICNGVPMVMIPLFGDQGDNVQRMVARGVAETLNIYDITSEKLLVALNKVINDKSYKEKMTKLSAIHRDRPVEPLDLAVFWTEFVMRHKGADHLRPAAHELNWVQYHSLDVIGFLLLVVVTVLFVTLKTCMFCFRRCCRKTHKKKKE